MSRRKGRTAIRQRRERALERMRPNAEAAAKFVRDFKGNKKESVRYKKAIRILRDYNNLSRKLKTRGEYDDLLSQE